MGADFERQERQESFRAWAASKGMFTMFPDSYSYWQRTTDRAWAASKGMCMDNGGRAHYIIESKVHMEAIFLATQQYPEIDWLGGKFPYTMTYAHGAYGPHSFFCSYQKLYWNTQWWNIQQKQQKREQTTPWTLTNEKCGPTTKAKTKKINKQKREREREREGERRVKIR